MELSDYRDALDRIDDQLLSLFCERMEISAQIAQYKREKHLPVLDSDRERQILSKVAEKCPDGMEEYATALYSLIMELSRRRQDRLINGSTDFSEPTKAADDEYEVI